MNVIKKQHMTIPWHSLVDQESDTPAIEASLEEKVTLIGRVGLAMLSAGTGAWRVRESMNRISACLGVTCDADIGLLSITFTCIEDGQSICKSLTLATTGVNTDKIRLLEWFVDSFPERTCRYSIDQFHGVLDTITSAPGHYHALTLGLASGLACASFTFLLGGGPVEMMCAFFGAGAGNYVRKLLLERHLTLLANLSLAVVCACSVYVILIEFLRHITGLNLAMNAGYICSMLFVIPGFPLITGGIDLAKLDMRSGLERLAYALLIIFTACMTGWICAVLYHIGPAEFIGISISRSLLIVLRLFFSFCGVFGFSLMFNSNRKMAAAAGCIGMVTNTLRLELLDHTSISPIMATLLASFCAGLLASMIKNHIGFPRISLTVPSIVIMVPGMFMYKAAYYIALNDLGTGGQWLSKAILVVTALPLGLVLARILTDPAFRTCN